MSNQKPHVTLYHNPRCSKSRKTLQLLQEKGYEPEIIHYLKTPPNREKLAEILLLLNMKPRDLMRKKEQAYNENRLNDPGLSHAELIDAMVHHPILIERPIVLANKKAALGRPPANVFTIL